MRVKRVACFALSLFIASSWLLAEQWKIAKPGYRFEFPRDHFEHLRFQSEWWYYTGNLRTKDGRRFGYELTFFRQANNAGNELTTPVWKPDQIYLAHLALSDIDGKQFFNAERLNRSGPGLAGAGLHDSRYWNGNWEVRWLEPGRNEDSELQAVAKNMSLRFHLHPEKPLVLEGPDGISRKGPAPGEASFYYSFPRLRTAGQIQWKGITYEIEGTSWMDHEFFTEPADNTLEGWDWLSIQLSNNEEIMLYRLRRRGESTGAFSSGTYIDRSGNAHYLSGKQFQLTAGGEWTSPETHNRYPVAWQISIPELGLELRETTPLKDQELRGASTASPTYWEGAVDYSGTLRGQAIKGVGYLEMTGYGTPIHLGSK